MNIEKMHEVFRTLGQQKGMQLVRAILPEEIDVYINDAITEKTRAEILKSINYSVQFAGNVNVSKMTNINLFKSLYRNARFKLSEERNDGLVTYYNSDNGYYEITVPTINADDVVKNSLQSEEYCINPMLYLSFALEYDDKSRGSSTNCRIIPEDEVENTMNDYCNRASKDYPIVTLLGIPNVEDVLEINQNVYNEQLRVYTNKPNCVISYLNIKYIKKPNVVSYNTKVDCDLAEYAHYEIVEKAVEKFLKSININQQ